MKYPLEIEGEIDFERLRLESWKKIYKGSENWYYRKEAKAMMKKIRELEGLKEEGFTHIGEDGSACGKARTEDVEDHVEADVQDQLRQSADEQDRVWFDRVEG